MFRRLCALLVVALCIGTHTLKAQGVNTATEPLDTLAIPTITVEDDNVTVEDDGVAAQSSGNMAIISRDPFVLTATNVFMFAFYQPRGYDRSAREVTTNGAEVNDAETGNAAFSQFGGLNDVFRSREVTWGLNPSPNTFGGIMGSNVVNATAADQMKQSKVSYMSTDQLYRNRLMYTYSTGMMNIGWAFSFSGIRRWAEQGYRPGTYYDGYSYYAGASKKLGSGTLNLTTYGSPTKQAKAGSATAETYQLDNNNYYNPYWGYQNGVIRSSRIENQYQPTTILNYDYRPDERTRWNTAISYEFGKDMTSFIDDYNAASPYGNYYRNLPSYLLTLVPPATAAANQLRDSILKNKNLLQINWNNLYQANYLNDTTIYNANGINGNTVHGHQSSYVLSDDVADVKKFSLNTTLERELNENLTISAGLTGTMQHTEYYEQLADLLGGDFFVNYNQFAAQSNIGNASYIQNNLKDPNQVVKVGDKYGYDYAINHIVTKAWGQALFNYNKVTFFFGAKVGTDGFQRDGFMQNGLFPNNSYGTSAMHNFIDYAVKGGITYKLSKHSLAFMNVGYSATPPTVNNTYISVGTRDFTVNNPAVSTAQSAEGGISYHSKYISARVLGYVTDQQNLTEIKRFYNDDPAYLTYVNYVMQNENERSIGTESFVEAKVFPFLKIIGVAAVGQNFYTNNPNISVYLDNDPTQQASSVLTYIKNYYVSSGPQSLYTLGFDVSPTRNTWINLHFNYYDRNYVEINPNRRTLLAGALIPPGSAEWNSIYGQEKLPSAMITDLRIGHTFNIAGKNKLFEHLSSRSKLVVTAGIFNLLNNTNYITFGYEQLRYDFSQKNPNEFPNKYIYGYGVNYNLNIALTF